MPNLKTLRNAIRAAQLADEPAALKRLTKAHAPDLKTREEARQRAVGMVSAIRDEGNPGLMEVFLAEYGLSTDEGIALMCLAEALLRVPDPETIDALIEDKIEKGMPDKTDDDLSDT